MEILLKPEHQQFIQTQMRLGILRTQMRWLMPRFGYLKS